MLPNFPKFFIWQPSKIVENCGNFHLTSESFSLGEGGEKPGYKLPVTTPASHASKEREGTWCKFIYLIAVKSRTQNVWILFVALWMAEPEKRPMSVGIAFSTLLRFVLSTIIISASYFTSLIEQNNETRSQSFVYMSQQIAFLRFQNLSFEKVKMYAHYYQITPLYPLYLGERLLKVAIVSGHKLFRLKLSKARRQNERKKWK